MRAKLTMAHRRKPLVIALALNTGALVVEVGAGIPAKSLSLVMDGVHNISDVALVIAGAIIVPTLRTVAGFHQELVWPENVSCGHESSTPRAADL
jgi:Co/Zn/Cd efflux system component